MSKKKAKAKKPAEKKASENKAPAQDKAPAQEAPKPEAPAKEKPKAEKWIVASPIKEDGKRLKPGTEYKGKYVDQLRDAGAIKKAE